MSGGFMLSRKLKTTCSFDHFTFKFSCWLWMNSTTMLLTFCSTAFQIRFGSDLHLSQAFSPWQQWLRHVGIYRRLPA